MAAGFLGVGLAAVGLVASGLVALGLEVLGLDALDLAGFDSTGVCGIDGTCRLSSIRMVDLTPHKPCSFQICLKTRCHQTQNLIKFNLQLKGFMNQFWCQVWWQQV